MEGRFFLLVESQSEELIPRIDSLESFFFVYLDTVPQNPELARLVTSLNGSQNGCSLGTHFFVALLRSLTGT